jgi:hypothetical protein
MLENIHLSMNSSNRQEVMLVPHDFLKTRGSGIFAQKLLSTFEQEMYHIISNDRLPMDIKLANYDQALQRFQKALAQQSKPLELEIKTSSSEEEPPVNWVSDGTNLTSKDHDRVYHMIGKIVPRKYKNNALLLLDYALENPRVNVSDKNELIIDKIKVDDSNIIDIISDISRPRKTSAPHGTDALMNVLLSSNAPRELFVNKQRISMHKSTLPLEYDDEEVYNESDISPTNLKAETPKHGSKKQKGGLIFNRLKWTPL